MDGAQTSNARQYPAPPVEPQRAMTEMEQHGAQLSDTAARVSRLADKLEMRVNSFMQSPTALGTGAGGDINKVTPAPQPGTLGCIQHYHREIDRAASRIDESLDKLAGII